MGHSWTYSGDCVGVNPQGAALADNNVATDNLPLKMAATHFYKLV